MSEGDPAMTALAEFVKTRPTKEQLTEHLEELGHQYPEAWSKLVFAGVFLTRPDWAARLAQWLDLLDRKVERAGFAEHPDDDYLWQLVLEGVLTFRDLKDGTADLGDVVAAHEALDRRAERMKLAADIDQEKAAAGGAQDSKSIKVAATTLAVDLLSADPTWRITPLAKLIKKELGAGTVTYVARAIRPTFLVHQQRRLRGPPHK
jgi:hypothetical protein